jgi:hypothetical protein
MDLQRADLADENREPRAHCNQLRCHVECLRMELASMPPRFREPPAEEMVPIDEVDEEVVAGADEPIVLTGD